MAAFVNLGNELPTMKTIKVEGEKHSFLIEDKIDAVAMPDQHDRYVKRGLKGVENGEYNGFDIFLFARRNTVRQMRRQGSTNILSAMRSAETIFQHVKIYLDNYGSSRFRRRLKQ